MTKFAKIFIIILIIALIITKLIFSINKIDILMNENQVSSENMEVYTDCNVIKKNFPQIEGIEECYWRILNKGNIRIPGPSIQYLRAFIYIAEENAEKINNSYSFDYSKKYDDFDKELLPENKSKELNLYFSEDLSKYILGTSWMGNVYFDYENKVIYLTANNF